MESLLADQEEPMLEPMSPALVGGFFAPGPSGSSKLFVFDIEKYFLFTLQNVEPVYTPTKVYNKDKELRK